MGSFPWESEDVIPGGFAGLRYSALNDPDTKLLNPDVFSPPMLTALGSVSLSSENVPSLDKVEGIDEEQQPKEGDK